MPSPLLFASFRTMVRTSRTSRRRIAGASQSSTTSTKTPALKSGSIVESSKQKKVVCYLCYNQGATSCEHV